MSLPSWERGLKYPPCFPANYHVVAPLVGAWIEISYRPPFITLEGVAPLVGAWIEIFLSVASGLYDKSLPSWERGLKSLLYLLDNRLPRRSPRGSVD